MSRIRRSSKALCRATPFTIVRAASPKFCSRSKKRSSAQIPRSSISARVLGKVVLLAALLTGARCYGVELDPLLVAHAQSAAASLSLAKAHFIEGDIRTVSPPPSDVYYMYIPLIHSTELVDRLREQAAQRKILVFAQALDLKRLPWLRASNASSYWLEMYESSSPRAALLADCERRINEARAAIFAADDGVVSKRMTELEREWRDLRARM